ncbi:TRAP transporter small permease [Amphritea sp.]|uniref:TRAP transporter small permease n=1 Tax=Amphritea sp. TaxID=1872502 RepID=UPI003569C3B4
MHLILNRIRYGTEVLLIMSLLSMVILTFADVIGRRLFDMPIYGAHDITEHIMALIVFSGLPLLTSARGHLAVDLFDRFIMSNTMRWWRGLICILIGLILLVVSYQFAVAAIEAEEIQEVSQELLIPRSYMYAFISLSCFISSLAAILPSHRSSDVHPEEAI